MTPLSLTQAREQKMVRHARFSLARSGWKPEMLVCYISAAMKLIPDIRAAVLIQPGGKRRRAFEQIVEEQPMKSQQQSIAFHTAAG